MACDMVAPPKKDEMPRDLFIEAPGGRLFARVWGGEDLSASPSLALLHDSLGCVELWRDFPAKLAAATGLPVVAYDRLGFGRSDPRRDRLAADFIRREGATGLRALREQLGIGRMILLGHSVGGGMAVAAGAASPEIDARGRDRRGASFRRRPRFGGHPSGGDGGFRDAGADEAAGALSWRQGPMGARRLGQDLARPRLRRLDPRR